MNFKNKFFVYLLVLILFPFEVFSQDSNKIVYDQTYFQKFNITNAADAIKRIPGVESLSSGNSSQNYEPGSDNKKRGFGSSGTQILINGEVATSYTFKMDYYWMMGDNRHNSQDSRYWGFVPEDHIVGKAVFVWMSWDAQQGEIRWDRLFTLVH